ncbi:hypothetical protein [Shewanella xiamenensis]|uniref:hypothetical protein n=1 Tax=Shewanella xiamenensis TaxID=332186 RepID=UPI00118701E2|nr:hypothetical protein [Shewanella xiamenensis]TVL30893.1 hypothetical protein AYI95_12160 [Shewanella xiamenensis]
MGEHSKLEKYIIASDVGGSRDGIGIEVYSGSEILMEVFRDDTQKTREVTLYKKEIPWEFQ